jgi:hypothetical protein
LGPLCLLATVRKYIWIIITKVKRIGKDLKMLKVRVNLFETFCNIGIFLRYLLIMWASLITWYVYLFAHG